jgi:type VI secretion system Hcp family effector
VKLTNASISSVRQVMPNNKNPEFQRYETYEEVSFVYGQIEWTWVDGGISTVDSWESSGIV